MLAPVLEAYGLPPNQCEIVPIGTGLINATWKINATNAEYILQKINTAIFKNPAAIAANINAAGEYLHKNFADYLFIQPLNTLDNNNLYLQSPTTYYRLFPFVQQSQTFSTAASPSIAFEAARQFGTFAKLLSQFPMAQLQITLPDFHNLSLRYKQFENALAHGNEERFEKAGDAIFYLKKHQWIVAKYEQLLLEPDFTIRPTHHDTKISNVLFDEKNNGLCVIDLDTLMPGYFISDVGDMMRTYLPAVSEEEADFTKIAARTDYFEAIVKGYLVEMKGELSQLEIDNFVFSGLMMTYMQALRFLTDYLQNDRYYGSQYPGQNLIRAGNQIALLESILKEEANFAAIVAQF